MIIQGTSIAIPALWLFTASLPLHAEDRLAHKAVEHVRKTIYHSPQRPGYSCWVGAWIMPDSSLMVCFTQATGPVQGRTRAPKQIQRKLDYPPNNNPGFDFTGLDQRNVHLRSIDGGASWKQVSADPFKSIMNGVTGECETALPDGTIVRGVYGFYLPYNPELPQTGFLQRSRDGSKTWGPPEVFLNPVKFTVWPRRLRLLRDGRLLLTGGLMRTSSRDKTRSQLVALLEPLLLVSADGGKTWSSPISLVPPDDNGPWTEEWDVAELPSGDLLAVFRRPEPKVKRETRWQGLLKKTGVSWSMRELRPAPFPHNGHPELLATREGPVLHFSPAGIHASADAGKSWQALDIPGSGYYPRSVQTADGKIHVFAHVGHDDPYGARDQSILMDTFRLVK